MNEKLKVYAVSAMAFSPMINAETKTEGTWIEHLPALIPAHSIDDAAELARVFAFEKWKPGEGWHGHQAGIKPVTKEFFELALNARAAGVIDEMSEEPEQVFQF